VDARLTAEQRELRAAAARLAGSHGPRTVSDLDDGYRLARLEEKVAATGWRALRADGAAGSEVALVAEEFGRGLVDVPFLGPVLADDLRRHLPGLPARAATIAVDGRAVGGRFCQHGLAVRGRTVLVADLRGADPGAADKGATDPGAAHPGPDLTRADAGTGPATEVGQLTADQAARWQALAYTLTAADILGAARGAHALAVEHARTREQYGRPIGSYQGVSHPLAEGLALIEGAVSVLRYAAWAVDELPPAGALRAARIAKVYTARAGRDVCETAVQVHGGIGNTWDCLVHLHLRRVLASTELFGVRLEEVHCGLP
jgi:Acyl-CoA dehydrogenase, C-terminal domain